MPASAWFKSLPLASTRCRVQSFSTRPRPHTLRTRCRRELQRLQRLFESAGLWTCPFTDVPHLLSINPSNIALFLTFVTEWIEQRSRLGCPFEPHLERTQSFELQSMASSLLSCWVLINCFGLLSNIVNRNRNRRYRRCNFVLN